MEKIERKATVKDNKLTLVTPPDDILVDGIRVLMYDLLPEHTQLISTVLYDMDEIQNTIIYICNGQDDTNWVLDKKAKCSIIVYNAESQNQTMVGYFTAQSNSYYFGNLLSLEQVNRNKIISKEQIKMIMEDQYKKHARI